MVQELAPPARRRRLSGHGMMLRRKRIFAGLREGLRYDEIAAQEGVTTERIRQIVAEVLKNRSVDSAADHAKLQLDRLVPALQIAVEAVASGDVRAIPSYLKVLDRLDRYQATAITHEVYDDEARKKLMDKINRLAENLGIDEDFAAAVQAHLKKTRGMPPMGGARPKRSKIKRTWPTNGKRDKAKRSTGCPSEAWQATWEAV
jgi:hypothetical protein